MSEKTGTDNRIKIPETKADLTKEWFEIVLSKAECGNVVVESVELSKGTSIGDNYLSEMLVANIKAKVDGKDKPYSLMCKLLPESEQMRTMGLQLGLFKREVNFYTILLPEVYKFQRKYLAKEDVIQFAIPKCYYAAISDKGTAIIMENMKALGFNMMDRTKGLSEEAVKLVLLEVARWHAVTLQMDINGETTDEYESIKKDIEKFKDIEKQPETKAFLDSMGTLGDAALAMVKDMPNFDKMESTFTKIFGNRMSFFEEAYNDDKPFKVLIHGDLWVNNMLFKENNGIISEINLVDWQIIRYVSPLIELNQMIYTSTTAEVWRPNRDAFLNIYYDEFCRVLNLFGTDPVAKYGYTREMMKNEFTRFNPIGLIYGMVGLQMMCAQDKDTLNLAEMNLAEFSEKRAEETKSGRNKLMKKRIFDVIADIYESTLQKQ